jgi:hypothetical protein
MDNLGKFHSLAELEKKWSKYDIDLKRLIRFAADGLIEVRVLCPDTHTYCQPGSKEIFEDIIDGSWEYLPIESDIITEIIGLGHDHIRPGTWISRTVQRQSLRRTEFCDLLVTKDEINRFENVHFKKSGSEGSSSRKGSHWADKRHEIICAALQVINDELSKPKSKILNRGTKEKINASKLAEEINDNRHRWPALSEDKSGASTETISRTIQAALKNTPRKSGD